MVSIYFQEPSISIKDIFTIATDTIGWKIT